MVPAPCVPILAGPAGGRPVAAAFEDTIINSETEASTTGGEARPGLRLELDIEPGERIEGRVTIVGETVGVPFKGWVEFMAAVDSLRTRTTRGADVTVPVTGRPAEPAHRARRRTPR